MARNVSQDLIDATSAAVVQPILLVEAEFDSATTRMWSGIGTLDWNGHDWIGGGTLLNIDAVEESTEVRAIGTRVSLSGIPSELISLALQENYQGRTLTVYLGAFDSSGDIITSPIIIFSGRMDIMTISEGGSTATIDVTVENRLIDFERTRERRYTSEDQKIEYPNDKGLEFVSSIQDIEIVWGKV